MLLEASRAVTMGWVESAESVLPLVLGEVVITSCVAEAEPKTMLVEAMVFAPEVAVRV